MTVVGQSVQQRRGHLRIPKHIGPLREAQVGRNHHAGAFVQFGQQMKQQGATGLCEWKVARHIFDILIILCQDAVQTRKRKKNQFILDDERREN